MSYSFLVKNESNDNELGDCIVKLDNKNLVYVIDDEKVKEDIRKTLKKGKIDKISDNDIDILFKKSIGSSNELEFTGCKEIKLIPYHGDYPKLNRDIIICHGASGLGKTYFIYEFVKFFKAFNENSNVFYFSSKPLNDDENLSQLDYIIPVELNYDKNEDQSSLYLKYRTFDENNEILPSLCIFDDVEGMGKNINTFITNTLNSILTCGRSSMISCIVSRHNINDSENTKLLHIEATKYVLFCQSSLSRSTIYALNRFNYFNGDIYEIEKLKRKKFILGDKSKNQSHPRCVIFNLTKNKWACSCRGIIKF